MGRSRPRRPQGQALPTHRRLWAATRAPAPDVQIFRGGRHSRIAQGIDDQNRVQNPARERPLPRSRAGSVTFCAQLALQLFAKTPHFASECVLTCPKILHRDTGTGEALERQRRGAQSEQHQSQID